jgi:hypothetical protein
VFSGFCSSMTFYSNVSHCKWRRYKCTQRIRTGEKTYFVRRIIGFIDNPFHQIPLSLALQGGASLAAAHVVRMMMQNNVKLVPSHASSTFEYPESPIRVIIVSWSEDIVVDLIRRALDLGLDPNAYLDTPYRMHNKGSEGSRSLVRGDEWVQSLGEECPRVWQTCLHVCARTCRHETLKLIVSRGGDPSKCDSNGNNLWHHFILGMREVIVDRKESDVLSTASLLASLLSAKAINEPCKDDPQNFTPLEMACASVAHPFPGLHQVVKKMLDAGAEMRGPKVIPYALPNENLTITLMEAGADVNTVSQLL